MWKKFYYNNQKTNYEVNELGEIKNSLTGQILKGNLKKTGYIEYNLYYNSIPFYVLAHRAVMETFNPNIDSELRAINHIDGDKTNNSLSNLEWCSYSQNEKHAWDNGLNKPHILRPVNQYTLDGVFIKTFKSLSEAVKATGATKIREVANGNRKSSGGYKWEWVEDFIPEDRGKKKRVAQIDNNKIINIFDSVSEAARITGSSRKGISAVCLGKQKKCNGFQWKFFNDDIVQ